MSLYYPLTPVERLCPDCDGHGRLPPDARCCARCDGIGRIWVDGAPGFGCKMTLGDRHRGEIVTIGNGDRGRIVRHVERGRPTTFVALIDEFFDTEAEEATEYPSETGVRSTLPAAASIEDKHGRAKARADLVDPLQRKSAL